jgi:hypothetical protein
MSDPMLRHALKLAGRGFRVHPLNGKVPLLTGWPDKATTDVAAIRAMWARHPNANVGIATGLGLVVIDIDPRNGGVRSRGELEALYGPLPGAVRIRTGGGGWHLYCHTNGSAVPSGVLARGVDVKAEGGQVVAPGSVHPDTGKTYRFAIGSGVLLGDLPVVPSWVPAKLSESRAAPAALPDVIDVGQRDSMLTSVAGSMRQRGASEAAILAALTVENEERCNPPLPESQIRKIVRSAGGWAPGVPSFTSFHSSVGGPCPVLHEAALQGVAGDVVRAIDPHTEASMAGILLQFLALVGNAFGRGPGFTVEADRHACNLFVVLVGDTSKGRKGVSFSQALRPVEMAADEGWKPRILTGASTGEGLIHAVRDERINAAGEVIAEGVDDKRLVDYEPEFASPLRRMRGESNSLGALYRQAWDGGRLATLTRADPLRASDSHITVIAHITSAELRRELTDTDTANGFANRFLFVRVERSKPLPHGGDLDSVDWEPMVRRIGSAIRRAQASDSRMLPLSDKAARLWEREYMRLSEGAPGMFGSVTSRAEAQVRRIAVIYAMLDGHSTVKVQHLRAGLAVWDYCEASARDLFGDRSGDDVADRILAALQDAPNGLTRQAISSDIFARNVSSSRISAALSDLQTSGKAECRKESTGGRPAERWHLRTNVTKETNDVGTGDRTTNVTKETREVGDAISGSSRKSEEEIA